MVALTPRYTPSWTKRQNATDVEVLIAYIDDLDVYYEKTTDDPNLTATPETNEYFYVVGPSSRNLRPDTGPEDNFDSYPISDNKINTEGCMTDIYMSLSDLCQLYQIAVEHGYITNED